jgi:transketolase
MNDVDKLTINTLRFLAVDAVEKAKSGHPGMPMGAAPMAYVLWNRFLQFNPQNPDWFNRDRFILSAGHGSMLLYGLLHLYGYDLPLTELERFRQWESKTPGHPEFGLTPGVEVTTGPLGQGFAMGVGMAIAEQYLAHQFNRPGFPVVDHFTYAIVSDGDLMEGVSSEAASLAGHLKLSRLIYLYDDNHVTIDGPTSLAFNEDVKRRFEAYGWHVQKLTQGNNIEKVGAAIEAAQSETSRPSLIIVRTHIGFGSPKQDNAAAHGEPLGADAVRSAKKKLGWPLEPHFFVPEDVLRHCRQAVERGKRLETEWNDLLARYRSAHPDLAKPFESILRGELPDGWDQDLPHFKPEDKPLATRSASGKVLNALAKSLPHLIGGSADLSPSNKTLIDGEKDFSAAERGGRNLRFGVREHAMMAALNGMARHGGVIPYGGTFLIFSDYMRPAIRLASLMKTHVIPVFTHDSIALGEDGPTHQPIEHLAALRAIPGLTVIRPADANETAAAWKIAVHRSGPTALILTRQDLPIINHPIEQLYDGVSRGAYVLRQANGRSTDIILIASGSEVHLILAARDALEAKGLGVQVVSMPSWELFDEQPREYRTEVLPAKIPKLAVEAGVAQGWREYVGENGDVMGLHRFGASAPWKVVYENLGFTVENVVARSLRLLGR